MMGNMEGGSQFPEPGWVIEIGIIPEEGKCSIDNRDAEEPEYLCEQIVLGAAGTFFPRGVTAPGGICIVHRPDK